IVLACLKYGLHTTCNPTPVVLAAHYMCGAIQAGLQGETIVQCIMVIQRKGAFMGHVENRLRGATVIDPVDYAGLEAALINNKVSLLFTESPTNPFLRCVDIELVSKLCHAHGAVVSIYGTFAPLNQSADFEP
ncbi:cystathionine gamma-synthase 1, chloroplastic-like protein, partial [Tanacetum coccineum]